LFVLSHSSSLLYLDEIPSARNIGGGRRSAGKFHFTFVKGVASASLLLVNSLRSNVVGELLEEKLKK
jgi:hypothetical protein